MRRGAYTNWWIIPKLEDMSFNPAIRNKAEALLKAREGKDNFIDYEFVDYKGLCYCTTTLQFFSPYFLRYRPWICMPPSFGISRCQGGF